MVVIVLLIITVLIVSSAFYETHKKNTNTISKLNEDIKDLKERVQLAEGKYNIIVEKLKKRKNEAK